MSPLTENKALLKALNWVTDLNVPAIQTEAAWLQSQSLALSEKQLVEQIFSKARWKATASGAATGLPSNPWAALPAATTDVALTLKTELIAVATAAAIYDPAFFDSEQAQWELLIPTLGLSDDGQFLKTLGVNTQKEVSSLIVRKTLTKEGLKAFKGLVLKHFLKKITKNGIFSKTIPLLGSVIGGSWNYLEVSQVRNRTIAYLQNRQVMKEAGKALIE
ncbi:hypothetical protein [Celerinatantimonas sp. YJH-8]|uniref:hypothetical protein n=1 Tax=Celerinatantimonas sp. YJH-8 TaxID=3228714 RepID=UPI0038CBEA0C